MAMLPYDSGILDLEHEARERTTAELVDQVSCLIEAPDYLRPYILNRLRIATWELRRRLVETEAVA